MLPPSAIAWYAWPHENTPKHKRRPAALAQLDDVCLQPESERIVLVHEQGTTVWTGVLSKAFLEPFVQSMHPPAFMAVLLQPNGKDAINARLGAWQIRTSPGEFCVAFPGTDTVDSITEKELWDTSPRWSWPIDLHGAASKRHKPSWPSTLPVVACLLLLNVLLLQGATILTRRATHDIAAQSRTSVQSAFQIPTVIDPVAQATKASVRMSPHPILDALAKHGLEKPIRIDRSESTLTVTWAARPTDFPPSIATPTPSPGTPLAWEWRLETP